jgi:hypothetical protein
MSEDGVAYRGLFGAYPFAFRQSPSWLFRSYVVASALIGLYIAILLGLAFVSWVATPVAFGDRALLGVIMIGVLVPVFGPVLIVARRYRRAASSLWADRLFAIAGYGVLVSLLLVLLISDPSQHSAPGPLSGLLALVDTIPRRYALVPLVVAVVGLALVVFRTRQAAGD